MIAETLAQGRAVACSCLVFARRGFDATSGGEAADRHDAPAGGERYRSDAVRLHVHVLP